MEVTTCVESYSTEHYVQCQSLHLSHVSDLSSPRVRVQQQQQQRVSADVLKMAV